MNSFYITTPIYYANAMPHLGHAYSTIVADSITRFHKMLGERALYLTGTDEHGDKIVQAAEKKNLSPRQFVDEISAGFRNLWPELGAAAGRFIRTTDERHVRAVQDFLQAVYDKGDIYFGEFGGWYCFGCERFYTEKELKDGLCPQHLVKPEFISEKNYFFRMSRYLPWLRQYLEERPGLIRPERYRRETLAMLEDGVLEDLCISRPKTRLEWGVELPFDKDYVCYVWFDALVSYISGIDWPNGAEFRQFWPGEHLIAKDILKPHAIFWPCMLKALDIPVYRHLNVHGYWLSRETKMSKSLGNVVDPLDMASRHGLDAFRYFLLREMRFGEDANFGEEVLIKRINADLANDLGNLFSRVLAMNGKYCGGVVPKPGPMLEADHALLSLYYDSIANYSILFANMEFSQALESLWVYIRALNKYVDSESPWRLFKENDLERLGTVLNILLASLHQTAICLWPVMPAASRQMLIQLGAPEAMTRAMADGEPPVVDLPGELASLRFLPQGRELVQASNLFPRIEAAAPAAKPAKAKPAPAKSKPAPAKAKAAGGDMADISAFNQLDIRVGTIVNAEKHPNADRILCLDIDFGAAGQRRILSGIAAFYKPEELAGRQVCAIINLPPREIRGIQSNGMVLTAGDDAAVKLLEPAQRLANGAKVS